MARFTIEAPFTIGFTTIVKAETKEEALAIAAKRLMGDLTSMGSVESVWGLVGTSADVKGGIMTVAAENKEDAEC